MLKAKVRLYPSKTGNVGANVRFKVTKDEPLEVSQVELASILIAYADVVLEGHSMLSIENNLKEALDIALKELEEIKGEDE